MQVMKSARDHTCNSVTIVKIIIMMYWSNTTYIAVRRSRVGLLSQLLSATPQVLDSGSSCELKREWNGCHLSCLWRRVKG